MDRPNLNIRDGGAGADFTNPVIFADVPDPDVVFDGRYYYMVSTTMYFAPSVPIMRSSDLVHWSIAGYTAAILDDADALALRNGQDAYGQGSWAASIRFHDGTYYVSVGSLTTQQTYVYSTPNIERGPWSRSVLDGYAHDQSLLFDGDDVWLVYGGGSIDLRRLRRHDDGTLAWDGPAGDGAAVVASDDFDNLLKRAGHWNTANADLLAESAENAWNGSDLGLQWQWNHNPDNRFWSLTERPGHLRLTTGSVASSILDARNTLTQRTLGPTSSGAISLDVSHMKDGDVAGISAYQRKYGYIAVTMEGATKSLVMRRAGGDGVIAFTSAPVPLRADVVYLRADVDFRDAVDTASFAYSYDGSNWTWLGDTLQMQYDLAHFTGYRFALFNYATAEPGGYVDVDWFRVSDPKQA